MQSEGHVFGRHSMTWIDKMKGMTWIDKMKGLGICVTKIND